MGFFRTKAPPQTTSNQNQDKNEHFPSLQYPEQEAEGHRPRTNPDQLRSAQHSQYQL